MPLDCGHRFSLVYVLRSVLPKSHEQSLSRHWSSCSSRFDCNNRHLPESNKQTDKMGSFRSGYFILPNHDMHPRQILSNMGNERRVFRFRFKILGEQTLPLPSPNIILGFWCRLLLLPNSPVQIILVFRTVEVRSRNRSLSQGCQPNQKYHPQCLPNHSNHLGNHVLEGSFQLHDIS